LCLGLSIGFLAIRIRNVSPSASAAGLASVVAMLAGSWRSRSSGCASRYDISNSFPPAASPPRTGERGRIPRRWLTPGGVIGKRDMLLGAAAPGECQRDFLDRFNRRGADYAGFEYRDDGPDFGFRRYFASCLRDVLPEKDQLWVIDQAMDIEAPAAIKALEKTLAGLFDASVAVAERRVELDKGGE
jgi:hypothetical protein